LLLIVIKKYIQLIDFTDQILFTPKQK